MGVIMVHRHFIGKQEHDVFEQFTHEGQNYTETM